MGVVSLTRVTVRPASGSKGQRSRSWRHTTVRREMRCA